MQEISRKKPVLKNRVAQEIEEPHTTGRNMRGVSRSGCSPCSACIPSRAATSQAASGPPATTRIVVAGGRRCLTHSVFWQPEDVYTEAALNSAATFLKANGVIRAHDAFEYMPDCIADGDEANCQKKRIRSGFQFVQTDYPWHVPDANGNVRAFSVYHEPGSRIYFESTAPWPGAWPTPPCRRRRRAGWRRRVVDTAWDTWGENTHPGLILDDYLKTCPGTGNVGQCTNFARVAQEDGEGRFKVASDGESDAMEICRQKNRTSGASYYQRASIFTCAYSEMGSSWGERHWRAPRSAPCKSSSDPNSGDVSDVCIGSMIALSARNAGDAAQGACTPPGS